MSLFNNGNGNGSHHPHCNIPEHSAQHCNIEAHKLQQSNDSSSSDVNSKEHKKTAITKARVKKTSMFMAVDIVMMIIFSYTYFKHVHHKVVELKPEYEAVIFTASMQTFFFLYYYTFDVLWDKFH